MKFDLKTFVTVLITLTLCVMTFLGNIDVKDFIAIAMMIYTYYFSKKEKVE